MTGEAVAMGGIELIQWAPSAIAILVLVVNNLWSTWRDNRNYARDRKRAAYLQYINRFDEAARFYADGRGSDPTVMRDYMAAFLEIKFYSSHKVYNVVIQLHSEARRMWDKRMPYEVEVFNRKRAIVERNCATDLGLAVDQTTIAISDMSEEEAMKYQKEIKEGKADEVDKTSTMPRTEGEGYFWIR